MRPFVDALALNCSPTGARSVVGAFLTTRASGLTCSYPIAVSLWIDTPQRASCRASYRHSEKSRYGTRGCSDPTSLPSVELREPRRDRRADRAHFGGRANGSANRFDGGDVVI